MNTNKHESAKESADERWVKNEKRDEYSIPDNDNDLIWHYTSFDNAINILDSRIMRATHYSFLNDRYEVKRPCELLLAQLSQIREETAENHPCRDIYSKAMAELASLAKNEFLEAYYVICFSKAKDSLPQWQGYTPSLGGCAIGFNPTEFRYAFKFPSPKEINNIPVHPKPLSEELIECKYVDFSIENQIDELKWICDTLKHDVDEGYPPIPDAKSHFMKKLYSLMLGIKDKAFVTEKEYRLAYPCRDANDIKFHSGKPYCELELKDHCYPCEIMISPHGDFASMEKSLLFLRAKICQRIGITDYGRYIEIIPSKLSYR